MNGSLASRVVWLHGDDDFARRWWSWWSQVADGELLDILDLLVDFSGDHFGVVVLVDLVLIDWNVTFILFSKWKII